MSAFRLLSGLSKPRRGRLSGSLLVGVLALGVAGAAQAQTAPGDELKAAVKKTKAAEAALRPAQKDVAAAKRAQAKAEQTVQGLAAEIKALQEKVATAPDKAGLFGTSKEKLRQAIQDKTAQRQKAVLDRAKAQADVAAAEARLQPLKSRAEAAQRAEQALRDQFDAPARKAAAEKARARAEAKRLKDEAEKQAAAKKAAAEAEKKRQEAAKKAAAAAQAAEKKRLAEAKRLAEDKARAEAKRQKDEAKRQAAAKKAAAEAEKKRQEAAKKLAEQKAREEELRKKAEAKRQEAAKRLAEKKAREAAEQRAAEEKRILAAGKDADKVLKEAQGELAAAKADLAEVQKEVNAAKAADSKAQALVEQRAGDLAAAKDKRARAKADSALKKAEKYAAKKRGEAAELAVELSAAQRAVALKEKVLAEAKTKTEAAKAAAARITAEIKAREDAAAAEKKRVAAAEAAEKARIAAEKKKKAEEARLAKIREEEAEKLAKAKAAEEKKRKAEEARLAKARAKEQERLAKFRAEEEKKRAAEQKKLAKAATAKEGKRVDDQKTQAETKAAEERKRVAEQKRLAKAREKEQKRLAKAKKPKGPVGKFFAGMGMKKPQKVKPAPKPAPKAKPAKPGKPPKPAKPVVQPRDHKREPLVSEPTPWTAKEVQAPPTLDGQKPISAPPAKAAAIAEPGKKLQFDLPMISGDKSIVEKLDAWQEWADHVTFNPVTAEEINEFHGKLTKALQEEGYVFAKVTFPTRIWAYGIFLAKIDCGPLGTITVKGNRHYSAKQVIRALARQSGERFNYARIHGDLFDLNTKPDIMVNTKLKPVIQDGRRVINAELEVRDDMPIHAAAEVSNTGTGTTNKWRLRTTLQHLNLTKRDDVLTVDWSTSPDLGDVNAGSGGYFLPLGDAYSLSLYGGYSRSDIEDALPQLDIRGQGHYFGGQITKTLEDNAKFRTQLSGAWVYQHSETEQDIGGRTWIERDLQLSMPSLTLGYASRVFDKLGGRNFLSNTVMANFAGALGSSEKTEFNEKGNAYADGEFLIDRFQIARLQRFFSGQDAPGKWTLFMKVDGQIASDTLVSAVRKSLGGANSVRGYKESEVSGDQGLVATLELRTPLFHNFIPGLKKSDEYLEATPEAWQRHRLQLIAFTDYGYVGVKEPRAGERPDETLFSAGVGLRLGLTKYSQMRADWGYPFEKTTEDTPGSGRLHLSMQLQF